MSRLQQTFERLKAQGRGGLVAYLTAGDPEPDTSAAIMTAVARAGADVLEIGVPFSDPLADGPVIQRAIERALASGMTLQRTLELVRNVRTTVDTPIVLFTYANPVLRMEPRAFARAAADAGVDGVLILDYPVEEAEPLRGPLVEAGLDPIFLVSPTTTDERIRRSGELGRGFLYVISRLGVTGMRTQLASDVPALLARVRASSSLPIAVGFGISSPEHVAEACRSADAAVVGSALVDTIARRGNGDAATCAGEYVTWLKSGL
ncbi:MAG: tryptophan synthase subunit alpha [Vicinamibacterales bacterium]